MSSMFSAVLLSGVLLPFVPVQQSTTAPPPPILQIYRDQVKPSKLQEYSRVEAQAAQACAHAHTWPYLAVESMTGPQEVWYISGFDSYAAVERSAEPFVRNGALAAELNRVLEAKSSLVESPRTVIAHYRDDLSGIGALVKPRSRFFTVTLVTVRPGHEREYEEVHRTLRSLRERASAADNRVVYQVVSGMPKNMYLIFSAQRTLQDSGNALDPAVEDYSGEVDESTRKRLDEYTRASLLSSETWIFAVNPSISNPAGEWIADDPEFCRSALSPQRPSVQKPAEQPTHK